ncbi:MAG: HD domain-containing protein [Bacteroidales bacterium]|nr:HD domain-containing protein [Clostridium sp.]MCM1203439.1 HD domain-containing protein [Bacteroidales bacterium]
MIVVDREDVEVDEISNYLTEDLRTEIAHGIEVSRLAGRLARELKLDTAICHDIEVAGMLHDIGKLRASTYLYGGEDDTLNVEKMRYVRMHAGLGYEVVKNEGYSDRICEMILHHHENYDGTGYPDNLVGERIPLGARILRVCDVFAALTSDRPYRKAFDSKTAVELLIEEVRHFDMEIFLPFQSIVHDEIVTRELNGGVQDKLVY